MVTDLVVNFAKYLYQNISGLDIGTFDELGEHDTVYWIEMSRNAIAHSQMLIDYINQEYNITR